MRFNLILESKEDLNYGVSPSLDGFQALDGQVLADWKDLIVLFIDF